MRIMTSKTRDQFARMEDVDIFREMAELSEEEENRLILQVPSLYVVFQKNPFLRIGKYVRRFDDGYEECIVSSPNGHLRIDGYRGPVFPHSTLGPFLMAVKSVGLDTGSERVDRRRKMAQVGG